MAEWIPPKTNWPVEDIPGTEDFNRIEGNIANLGARMDPVEKYVIPSENVLMQALARRRGGSGDQDWVVVKRFRVKYEGLYRVEFELQNNPHYESGDDWEFWYYPYAVIGVEQNQNSYDSLVQVYSSATYVSGYYRHTLDLYVPAGGVIYIAAKHESRLYYAYIRNAKVKGTVTTRGNVPDSAVLQD